MFQQAIAPVRVASFKRKQSLIGRPFIRPHVAATRVLLVGTRLAALIGGQQLSDAIGAAAGVARIDGRATCGQCHGLRGSAVITQTAELRVGAVQITRFAEIACVIAAQVVSMRGYGAVAVAALEAARDNAVLERHRCSGVTDAAAGHWRAVTADGAVTDLYGPAFDVEAAAAKDCGGAISGDGAVGDHDCARASVDSSARAACRAARAIPVEGAVVDRQRAAVQDCAPIDEVWSACVLAEGTIVDRQGAVVVDASARSRIGAGRVIAGDGAGGDRQRPRIVDTAARAGHVPADDAAGDRHLTPVEDGCLNPFESSDL